MATTALFGCAGKDLRRRLSTRFDREDFQRGHQTTVDTFPRPNVLAQSKVPRELLFRGTKSGARTGAGIAPNTQPRSMPSLITFNTQEVNLWNNPQKMTSKVLSLPKSYADPPKISVGLNMLDFKAGTGIRCNGNVSDIDNRKFTVHIDTWADTTLWAGEINCFVMRSSNHDFLCGEFSTTEDHVWNKPQLQTSRRIHFERPYSTPPNVVVWLKSFDTGEGSSTRVKTFATDIDAKGFTIHIDTWADTKLWSAIAGWIAYPKDKEGIFCGRGDTIQVRPWQNTTPGVTTRKAIYFGDTAFHAKPSVFVALDAIDCSTAHGLRFSAYATDISTHGMTWHIDSWGDTILHSAGISFIAFNHGI
ncbi:hypothetical protein FRB90_011923 [Tulasnella sp. 427]|nr:hypothetical protein FRB90_011923 [Tulasnella sp. 427]